LKVSETALPGVLAIEPASFGDERGYFFESYRAPLYHQIGITRTFVQDNVSFSRRHVLRGLHAQQPNAQGKLVFVLSGCIFDVAVDVRAGSPNFGRWVGIELSADTRRQVYVPPGFLHGFCVMSETALVCYKCTDIYNGAGDFSVIWNDPELAIAWPTTTPVLSAKDAAAPRLRDLDPARLLPYSE
jgi:dTDP-4-dehydrorhamnose 3,5-epimerase